MEINDDNTIVVTTTRGCMTIKKRVKIPTKLSELKNDSGYIVDPEYVHTDNNFTDSYKSQVDLELSWNMGRLSITEDLYILEI